MKLPLHDARRRFPKIRDRLNVRGFTILLEIAAHMQPCRLDEIPYTFGPEARGQSKLSKKIVFAHLSQLWLLYRDVKASRPGNGVGQAKRSSLSRRFGRRDVQG